MEGKKVFGVVAQFGDTEGLVEAANKVREAGYTTTDAYSPIPVHGLYNALGGKRSIIPWLVFTGGVLGGLGGFLLQYWVTVVEYPVNIGGRPMFSWPSFIPIIFECTILGAALAAVIGMFALNRLPELYHPIFNAENFESASDDKFFLCIEAQDPQYNQSEVTDFLNSLSPENVCVVEK